eukprot:4270369-Prymnesium_polylepis.1
MCMRLAHPCAAPHALLARLHPSLGRREAQPRIVLVEVATALCAALAPARIAELCDGEGLGGVARGVARPEGVDGLGPAATQLPAARVEVDAAVAVAAQLLPHSRPLGVVAAHQLGLHLHVHVARRALGEPMLGAAQRLPLAPLTIELDEEDVAPCAGRRGGERVNRGRRHRVGAAGGRSRRTAECIGPASKYRRAKVARRRRHAEDVLPSVGVVGRGSQVRGSTGDGRA